MSQVSDFVRGWEKWGGRHCGVEGSAKSMQLKEEWRVELVVGKLTESLG